MAAPQRCVGKFSFIFSLSSCVPSLFSTSIPCPPFFCQCVSKIASPIAKYTHLSNAQSPERSQHERNCWIRSGESSFLTTQGISVGRSPWPFFALSHSLPSVLSLHLKAWRAAKLQELAVDFCRGWVKHWRITSLGTNFFLFLFFLVVLYFLLFTFVDNHRQAKSPSRQRKRKLMEVRNG